MKKYKIIFALFTLCLTLGSCRKFLDEPQNSLQSPLNSVEACQAILDNIGVFNSRYPLDGEVFADNYYITSSEFGGKSEESRAIYQWLPTAQRLTSGYQIANHWKYPYAAIYQANVVLEAVPSDVNDGSYNEVKGNALFHRAFNLFQLAVLYCKAYDPATAETDLGVPVRIKSDVTDPPQRGTVKQTYDQIILDLKEAVDLLPVKTVIATRPSKVAAYAALARIYNSIGDYVNAGNAANSALNLYSTLMDYNTLEVNSSFVRFNKEVLFDAVAGGYEELLANAKVSPDLYALYPDNDLRKQLFFNDYGDGTFYFTGGYNGGGIGWTGIATDELYLVRAESYARAGNTNAAMADLNTLLKNRYVNTVADPYVNMTASNADDALAKILTERRKELAFRAMRWMDLKRLNKDSRFAVTLSRTINGTTYTLPPNDLRYQMLLPEDVMKYSLDDNGNSRLPQNPR